MRSSRPAVALFAVCQLAAVATADNTLPIDRLAATIRIDTGGSGVIVSVGKEAAFGLSCSHCAGKPGETSGFYNHDGSRGKLEWRHRYPKSELSVFRCSTKDVRGWCPVSSSPSPPYTAAGYTGAGDKLCRKWLKSSGVFRPSNLKFDRWELSYDYGDGFGNGDSGGPVFGKGPRVVSIISHGDRDNTELYAATIEQMKRATVSVRPLNAEEDAPEETIETRAKWWGDKDRTVEIVKLWKALESYQKPPDVDLSDIRNRLSALEKMPAPDSVDLSGVQSRIEILENKLNRVLNTPIRVQILDPKTKKVLVEKSYPYGTPVRLMLPERR